MAATSLRRTLMLESALNKLASAVTTPLLAKSAYTIVA